MSAVPYIARRNIRHGWVAVIGLAGIVALVVVVMLGATMAARRSSSALERFQSYASPSDLFLLLPSDDPAMADRIAQLDEVDIAAPLVVVGLAPEAAGSDGYFPMVVDIEGTFLREVDRPIVVDGALPALDDPLALVVNEATADRLGLAVGDEVPMQSSSPADVEKQRQGGDFVFHGPDVTMHLSAIVRNVFDLVADPDAVAISVLTPAFLDTYEGRVGADISSVMVARLNDGVTAPAATAAISELPGGDGVNADDAGGGSTDTIETGLRAIALALAGLAVAAGLAGAVAATQAAARVVGANAADNNVLAGLGLGRRERAASAGAPAAVAVGVGVLIGVAVAPWVAAELQVGLAGRAEVDPGPYTDWAVMLGGGLGLLAILGSAVGVVAVQGSRLHRAEIGSSGGGWFTSWSDRVGLPLLARVGIAVVFSRHGRPVPSRQAVVAAIVGIAGVVGVATFASGLADARTDPRTYGWGWDAAVGEDVAVSDLDDGVVTDSAIVRLAIPAQLDGNPVSGMSVDPERGIIEPVLVRGRQPKSQTEVLIGEKTLSGLGLEIGDEAELGGGRGSQAVRIVGTVVFPTIDDPSPLARGVVIDSRLVASLGLVDEESLDESSHVARVVNVEGDPSQVLGETVVLPEPPEEVARLDEVRAFPAVLAGFLSILAAVTIGHAFAVIGKRRRRDLALLETFGFTHGQIRLSLLSASMVPVVIGLALGVPLGLAVGRTAWRVVTSSIGIPYHSSWPVAFVAATAGVATLVAVVAWLPIAVSVGLRRPAVDLRTE